MEKRFLEVNKKPKRKTNTRNKPFLEKDLHLVWKSGSDKQMVVENYLLEYWKVQVLGFGLGLVEGVMMGVEVGG